MHQPFSVLLGAAKDVGTKVDGDFVGIPVSGDVVGSDVTGDVVGSGVLGDLVGFGVTGANVGNGVGSGVTGEREGEGVGKGVPTVQHALRMVVHILLSGPLLQAVVAAAGDRSQAKAEAGVARVKSSARDSHGILVNERPSWHPLWERDLQVCA